MLIDSGVHYLHLHCHNQTIYENYIFHLSPYERMMLHLKHVNFDHVKRATDVLSLEFALNDLADNGQVSVFNSTIMNIFTNLLSNETITYITFDE